MFKTLLLLFTLSIPSLVDAQVRVRGYTRKDGTYVRPHTRSSPGGGSSYSSSDSNESDDDDTYDFNKMSGIIEGKKVLISKKKFVNGKYRLSPTIMLLQPNSYSRDAVVIHDDGKLSMDTSGDSTAAPIYLSVFRINGKVADVVAFSRNILDYSTDFSQSLYHSINKSLLTAEQSLELIDKYGFSSREGVIRRSVSATPAYNTPSNLPPYLTHQFEVIRLK